MNYNIPMRIIIIITTLFCMLIATAQTNTNKGKITGKVIDATTRLPVDFATITVFKIGVTNPINGISADQNGNFTINNIPEGEYKVTADFIGYKTYVIDKVTINSKVTTVSLGTILLNTSQIQLDEVTIVKNAPIIQNKIDKLVYNAANDLTGQGGVVIDILKKVPMVSVDIDGNVELQGNSNIRFLINGKPSSIFGASLNDALQSIPASQIKSIEVITSPGAKYDANGTGGIINIVLKDSKIQGINGSVNLSGGTRLENGSLNLNARKGNFGIGVFFSGNKQLNTITKNTTDRVTYSSAKDTITNLYLKGESPFTRNSYQTGVNFNWSITPKDELTATMGYDHFENTGTGATNQEQLSSLADGTVFSDIINNRNSVSNFSNNATDISVGYKKTFEKEDRELEVTYSTSYGKNRTNAAQLTDFGGNPTSGLRSYNPGKDHETNIAVDYVEPLSKGFTIETGAKVVLENLNNNVVTDTLSNNGTYVNNAGQTYGFIYKRNIYAAYLSSSFELFHSFLNGKAGLRYERTNTTANFTGNNIPRYDTFAPSFTIQHKIGEHQSVKFAYSYRIERPDYEDLNPFFNISDPHNISTGNPLLKPEIGNRYELGYSKTFDKGGNIYFSGYYRYNTEDIQPLTSYYALFNANGTDYSNVTVTQRYNIGTQTTIGASIFGSVPLTKALNIRSNIDFGERKNSSPGLTTSSSFTYRINLNASYLFANNLTAELFGNYRSSQKNIQSTRPSSFSYNLAVKKLFLNKNASIGLTAANPFNRYLNQKSTSYGANYDQINIRQVPVQSFGIILSYKFGKLDFKKKDQEDPTPEQPAF